MVLHKASTTVQRDDLLGELAKLAQCWQQHNMPELAQLRMIFHAVSTAFATAYL
jgi:hypothetical protein